MKRRLPTGLLLLQASVVLLVALLAAYSVARGQGLAAAAGAKGAGPAAESVALAQARFDRLRAEGFAALYGLDYEAAQAKFREMARDFPDHPAGWQFQAASLWLKTLNGSRRLQSNLYNDDQFYEGDEDKTDPKIVAEFKELTRNAKQLAEARLRKNKKDVEALYYLGATQGLKAAFAGAVERRFMGALQDGKDAVDLHEHAVKLDPTMHDARLSIGMYDYIVGGLPRPVKLHLFKLETADALVSQAATLRATDAAEAEKIEREAFSVFESLLKERGTPAARQADQIHFQYAEALSNAGQDEPAAKEYLASADTANADAGLATMARLRAAQSYDLAGKRAEAVAQYKAVLARPDRYKAHEAAGRGLKAPFRKTDRKRAADAEADEQTGANKANDVQ
ncbi:MAG: hypothetical protein LC800_22340 [Acidobacteria bacterium]|nr:hypothetical protein [Acidobacteriota bacterium]